MNSTSTTTIDHSGPILTFSWGFTHSDTTASADSSYTISPRVVRWDNRLTQTTQNLVRHLERSRLSEQALRDLSAAAAHAEHTAQAVRARPLPKPDAFRARYGFQQLARIPGYRAPRVR